MSLTMSNSSGVVASGVNVVASGVNVVWSIIRDNGNYTCNATDSLKHVSVSKTFYVRVVGKWIVRKKTGNLYLT